jgi:hypothetical protein
MRAKRLPLALSRIGCILAVTAQCALSELPDEVVRQQATHAITHPPQAAAAGNLEQDLNPFKKLLTQIIAAKKFVWVAIAVAFIQGRRMLRKLEEEKAKEAEEANRREAFEKPHDWRY